MKAAALPKRTKMIRSQPWAERGIFSRTAVSHLRLSMAVRWRLLERERHTKRSKHEESAIGLPTCRISGPGEIGTREIVDVQGQAAPVVATRRLRRCDIEYVGKAIVSQFGHRPGQILDNGAAEVLVSRIGGRATCNFSAPPLRRSQPRRPSSPLSPVPAAARL
jgi:hypothetical protein